MEWGTLVHRELEAEAIDIPVTTFFSGFLCIRYMYYNHASEAAVCGGIPKGFCGNADFEFSRSGLVIETLHF